MVWSRRLCLAMLSGLLALSCLSPTLPLPPPSRPEVSPPDQGGQVRLRGAVLPSSQAVALNLNNDAIAGQNTGADGRYDFTITAAAGDTLNFFYMTRTRQSGVVTLVVPAFAGQSPGQ